MLLISSGGGHWIELKRLSGAFEEFDALYVSTLKYEAAPSGSRPVEIVRDASRSDLIGMGVMAMQVLWKIVKFRPQIIISTGAAPGLLALRIGKLLGARTVWIDSIANADELSLSGKLAEKYADLWLTQWPHLTTGNAKLQYFGAVM
jgi:UDP-N-acetylglucosamine:LPS N-acetylglucosamine transferase